MPRALALSLALVMPFPAAADVTLKVMSYNIWGGGGNEGKGIEETVAAIKAAGADVVGLQETRLEGETCTAESCPPQGDSVAAAIAAALGWQVHDQTGPGELIWANAVISRYPITGTSPQGSGVSLDVEGRAVWLFNIHLDDEPYQPYQILGIEYGPAPFIKTPEEAVKWATDTRGPALDILFADMAVAEGAAAVFVTGDFNEPSHRDWTSTAVEDGLKPLAVSWPTTARFFEAGFKDAYREIWPDPTVKPAFTWTPTYPEDATDDHPDRIDFVLARGQDLRVTEAAIVGENGPRSDIVVTPWPSDHRAVVATVVLP
jgi:exodeoxyribonuclease-3